jgi:hypothetical protein
MEARFGHQQHHDAQLLEAPVFVSMCNIALQGEFLLVFGPWPEWHVESEGFHVNITGLLEPAPEEGLARDRTTSGTHGLCHLITPQVERIIGFQGTIVAERLC